MAEQDLKVVGQSVLRRDGMSHVTGKTQYIDDIRFPDMVYLKMVRSPLHHAHILGIDFSEAEKVPGFVRAFTYKDVPKNLYTILCLIGVGPDEEPVLAEDEVRFKGEQIAAIVAETEEAANEAVARTKVDLEELPAVFDVEEALKPGAPILKPWGTNYFVYEGHHCRRIRFGDVEKGFAEADFIVEGRYEPGPVEHAPLETTGCVAKPEADGRITVYTNTQALYFSMDNTALILQVPFNKLHFVGGQVGGGFGGKNDVIVEPIATLAAMRTGRPVKYLYTREEEFHVSSTRIPYRIYFKDGVMKDGRIVARKVISYGDAGAYNRHTPYSTTKHAANLCGPYTIPNVYIDAYCVYTNRVPTSSMRGLGVTSASFSTEVQMDKIARTVGMDPFEIRVLNGYRNGDMRPYQKVVSDATLVEVVKTAADMVGHPLGERFQAMNSWDRDYSPPRPEPVTAKERS
jgi:CO/xanthine dehydrogenase Mo-binding subunit